MQRRNLTRALSLGGGLGSRLPKHRLFPSKAPPPHAVRGEPVRASSFRMASGDPVSGRGEGVEGTGGRGHGKEHRSTCSSSRFQTRPSGNRHAACLLSRLERHDGAAAASEARGATPNLEERIHMANERTETKHWYCFP